MSESDPDFSYKSLFVPLTTFKAITFIILIGFAVFLNSLFNGFVYDDIWLVSGNPLIQSFNLPKFFTGGTYVSTTGENPTGFHYQPILTTIYSVIYSGFGNIAFFFHFFQLIFFIGNSILAYLIFKKFVNPTAALLGALLFLVHPINSEVASYIANFQDTLFFFFGALALLISFNKPTTKSFFLISIFLLFSALSKETGILFLFIIPAYQFLFKTGKFKIYSGISFLVLLIYLFLRFGIATLDHSVDTSSLISELSLPQRMLNIPAIIQNYLSTFLFPKNLVTSEYWIIKTPSLEEFYLPLLWVSLITLGFAAIFQKLKTSQPAFLFFAFIFILGLGMHLQIIPLDGIVANRWFYLPSFGLIGMILITSQFLSKYKFLLLYVTLIIIFIFSIRTIVRNSNFSNTLTLLEHDTRSSSGNYLLENAYGYELMNHEQMDLAKEHLEKSISFAPNELQNWNNLGVWYSIQGDKIKAETSFKQSISNGNFYLAHKNLTTLYLLDEKWDLAKTTAYAGLQNHPQSSDLWLIIAIAEDKMGNYQESLSAAKQAYSITPNNSTLTALTNLQDNKHLNTELLRKNP